MGYPRDFGIFTPSPPHTPGKLSWRLPSPTKSSVLSPSCPPVFWPRNRSVPISGQPPAFLFLAIGEGLADSADDGDSGNGRGLTGRLPEVCRQTRFAHTSTMGRIARATRRPLYLLANSVVASRAPFPPPRTALEWRFHVPPVWGRRIVQRISPSPDLIVSHTQKAPGVGFVIRFSRFVIRLNGRLL